MNSGNNYSPVKNQGAPPNAGFFASPSGQFGGQMSQGTPSKQAHNDKSLLPATILQVQNSSPMHGSDNKFTIDGHELSTVKLVGSITSLQVQSTNIQYTIDDSTGSMEVKVWLGDDEDDPDASRQRSELVEGKYVRVFGRVQEYNGTRSISAYSMSVITDFNEIAKHFSLAMLSHLRNTRGEPGSGQSKPQAFANNPLPSSSIPSASDDSSMSHMTPVQRAVCELFRSQHVNEEGISRASVAQGLPNFQRKEVYDAIEYLSSEGHLYTTLDDEHYCSTNRDH